MMMVSVPTMLALAIGAAVLSLIILSRFTASKVAAPAGFLVDDGTAAEYLFDGETLIDATPAGRGLLPKAPGRSTMIWGQLLGYLEQRFPGVQDRLNRLPQDGTLVMTSAEDGNPALLLRAEFRGGLTRISLIDTETTVLPGELDPLTQRANQDELELLRDTVTRAPMAIWRESPEGEVVWANGTYLDLASQMLGPGEDLSWPLPTLFATDDPNHQPRPRRSLEKPDGSTSWFNLIRFSEGDGALMFAIPADATVQAENSLRAFMQTLTKTFAQLPTGLAIFDGQRRLALFNPALMDLTSLPADLLTSKPTLVTFFDCLRERSMIPEPRDYSSWRKQITDLEQAASSGFYQETWSLPGGQTYRVTGRPHPNGALALLFEDISTEITQTRRYQADLQLGQAVIDAMDEATAVFSSSGVMVLSNAAYSDLWGHDPAGSLSDEAGISATSNHWRSLAAPGTLWDRAEDFILASGPRDNWDAETRLRNGDQVLCRFAALDGGSSLAAFRRVGQAENVAQDVPLAFTSARRSA